MNLLALLLVGYVAVLLLPGSMNSYPLLRPDGARTAVWAGGWIWTGGPDE